MCMKGDWLVSLVYWLCNIKYWGLLARCRADTGKSTQKKSVCESKQIWSGQRFQQLASEMMSGLTKKFTSHHSESR